MIKRLLLVATLVATLAACATPATMSRMGELPPEDGLVVMRLSSNSFNVGFFQYWNVLTVEEVGGQNAGEFLIGLSRKGNARTAVYLGHLPPGTYRLKKLSSEQCGAICITSTITMNEQFGNFVVEAGRTTELGHVTFKQQSDGVIFNRGHSMETWLPAYINEYYENIPAGAVLPPYLDWADDPERGEMFEARYKRSRVQTLGLLSPTPTAEGHLLFGSFLGMVKRWEPGKVMVVYDTGLQGGIESVVEVTPDTWLVGGENGRLRVSYDRGRNWQDFGDGFPFQNIAALNTYEGRIFATVSTEDTLSVYETTLDDTTWRELSSHELEFSFWTGVPIFPQSIISEDKLITTLPTNGLLVTDLKTGEAVTRTFPGSIFKFGIGGDGVLRCMCTKALFNNPWNSKDLGETWERSTHDRYMWVPHFVDDTTGYGILKGRFLRTTDGGETWEDVGEAPKFGTRIGNFPNGDLYAMDDYGIYYRSADGGVSWERT